MKPGVTKFDTMCHEIFGAKNDGFDYLAKETGVKCGRCGIELKAYYCESRLYVVECPSCKVKALAKAGSPIEAAYKTFGWPLETVEDIGEECGVFFNHTPIDEPPRYVGSTIDCNFPWEDVVCGMLMPCPGTDGKELKEEGR